MSVMSACAEKDARAVVETILDALQEIRSKLAHICGPHCTIADAITSEHAHEAFGMSEAMLKVANSLVEQSRKNEAARASIDAMCRPYLLRNAPTESPDDALYRAAVHNFDRQFVGSNLVDDEWRCPYGCGHSVWMNVFAEDSRQEFEARLPIRDHLVECPKGQWAPSTLRAWHGVPGVGAMAGAAG